MYMAWASPFATTQFSMRLTRQSFCMAMIIRLSTTKFSRVCRETDDVGAIYLAHNPTYRGNVIRHNYIHDLGGFSTTGVMGIYLDDFASGTHVSHNILERAGRGVAIGGGRDNLVENNVFLDCLAAVQIDNRGTTWARGFVKGNESPISRYLAEIEGSRETYVARYPDLANYWAIHPKLPRAIVSSAMCSMR